MEIEKLINEVKGLLAEHDEAISSLPAGEPDDPPVDICISNTKLLLDALQEFIQDKNRVEYLPISAKKPIVGELTQGLQQLRDFAKEEQEDAKLKQGRQALKHFDTLYTVSLRLGLLSFGLDAKELQRRVSELTALIEPADTEAKRVRAELLQAESEGKEAIQAARKDVDKEATQVLDDLHAKRDAAQTAATEAHEHRQATQQYSEKTAEILSNTQQLLEDIRADKEAVSALRDNATTLKTEVDAQKTAVQEAASQAKAHQEQAAGAWGSISTQLEEVKKFYGTIETHQNEMIEVKKEADAHYGDLNTRCEDAVADFGKRTEEILAQNEGLQKEIRSHLEKAVGTSLFKAFDHRRTKLRTSKWIWAFIILISVAGLVGLTMWIVETLGERPDAMFAMRVAAMLPAIYLLGFGTSQYAKERRAEEEYAFKSTISVSLRPYYDLVQRIRKEDKTADVPYLKSLVNEVFDNPVRRIHGKEKTDRSEKALRSIVTGIIQEKGLTPEQVIRALTEAAQ